MASSDDGAADAPIARSSGRIRKRPETLYDSSPPTTGGKRRHTEAAEDEDEENDGDDSSDEGEPDEEELRERRARVRKQKATAARQPPLKKSKVNGTSTLAFRTATGRSRAKGNRLSALDAESAGGIFADVFAHNKDAQEIVSQWLSRFEQHEARALAEIINFVLRAAGCTSSVSDEHMEDPDAITGVVTDLQDEFQATDPTDYPLVKKGKTATTVKQGVTHVIDALIKSIAQTGTLFTEPELVENIQVWFSTMSTAANRPFRHTATVVSLITMTALAEVARDVADDAAKTQRQAETERKKAAKNKARIQEIEKKVRESTARQEAVETVLNDWYTTVFIHRYKDVDAAIRRECAASLGQWIVILPSLFLDSEHLRYLGWMLSDSHISVRLEAVKQLNRLYKDPDMSGGLKSFTEKFRPRLVEMATSDADTQVRTSAIELLDQLRDNGLLQPDDIDAIGRLIFESDARVRKATAKFLSEGIEEVYIMKVDELGGNDTLVEALSEPAQDDYNAPRVEWLKLKCLAETLQAYHTEDVLPSQVQRSREHGGLILQSARAESRFSLAADALYDKVAEMHVWRTIAGYLLFDASTPRKKRASLDTGAQFKRDCLLSQKEEITLLEVLHVSVRNEISSAAEKLTSTKSRLTKQQKADLRDEIEETARYLLAILPKLFERYGDAPESASIVLHIQQVLTSEVMSNLGQESRAYDSLLEKDKRQFLSHSSNDIPESAANAMLQAILHGNDDSAAEKIASLYEDIILRLVQSVDVDSIEKRGSASVSLLTELNDDLLRLMELAKISDPTTALEDAAAVETTGEKGDLSTPIDYVIALASRAQSHGSGVLNTAVAGLEDEIALRAGELVLFYLRWRFRSIKERVEGSNATDIPYNELEALAARRDKFVKTLSTTMQQRRPREDIYSEFAGLTIELQVTSSILETVKRGPNVSDDYTVFIMDLEEDVQRDIMKAFAGAEAVYANLCRKRLTHSSAVETEDLTRFDDDPVSDSEDEDGTSTRGSQPRSEEKMKTILLAEQRLCMLTSKIVLAVLGDLMDRKATRTRVERNKSILGPNFKAVCEYFDHGKPASRKKSKPVARAQQTANGDARQKSRKDHAVLAESENEDEIEDDENASAGGIDPLEMDVDDA